MSEMARWEADNFDWLLDKFLKLKQEEWVEFVSDEFSNQPEPPDRSEDE